MTNLELVERIRTVLRELSLLSEGRALSYDGDRVQGGESKSAPPPGYGRDLRELSLAAYWHKRFAKAKGNVERLTFFLYLAELDLHRHKFGVSIRDPHESKADRQARIVEDYEGMTDVEAALAEDCDPVHIRVARYDAGRDPGDGYLYGHAG